MWSLSFLFMVCLTAKGVTSAALTTSLYPRDDTCEALDISKLATDHNDKLQAGDDGTDDSTEWDDGNLSSSRRVKRVPDSSAWWPTAVSRGRSMWQRLQDRLAERQLEDKPKMCGLIDRWDISSPQGPGLSQSYDYSDHSLGEFLPSELLPVPQPKNSFISFKAISPKGPPDWFFDFKYHEDFSPEYGVIQVVNTKGYKAEKDGHSHRAPDRWSDLTWSVWVDLCKNVGKPPSGLKLIIRDSIGNPRTESIIKKVIYDQGHEHVQDDKAVYSAVLSPNSDGVLGEAFYAMLGSPNVIGVVYMLIDYMNGVGRKTIKNIGVHMFDTNDEDEIITYYAWIELEDFRASSDSSMRTRPMIETAKE